MAYRVRHCVECPKCQTRYLLGYSPFRNGSFLVPMVQGFADGWTLYCSCAAPHVRSRWDWNELKQYVLSSQAHERGFGPPEEIIPLKGNLRVTT